MSPLIATDCSLCDISVVVRGAAAIIAAASRVTFIVVLGSVVGILIGVLLIQGR